uniref:A-kinase anchor protein 7-like phosphoesterase domain-containing protein n=1 Tax=Kalanchoe fedtschenkoi TaxID=63787 RepID=A0A7N0V4S9_KALFE
MRGSLAKARVLYAPVEEIGGEGRLVRACRVLIDAYVEAGLVLEKDAKQRLKVHATVMNTSHRRSQMRSRKFDSFDARSILERRIGESILSAKLTFLRGLCSMEMGTIIAAHPSPSQEILKLSDFFSFCFR